MPMIYAGLFRDKAGLLDNNAGVMENTLGLLKISFGVFELVIYSELTGDLEDLNLKFGNP